MTISVTYALCGLFAALFAMLSILDHRKVPRNAHLRTRNLVGVTVWTLGALILFARAFSQTPKSNMCKEHASWGIRPDTSCPICALLQLGEKRAHIVPDADVDFFTCSMHPQIHEPKPGKCPICGMPLIGMKAEQTPKVSAAPVSPNGLFTCSMHPQIKLPKPGKCPICFMDLIRAENEE